ncbi:hypothetical protein XBFFR1_2400001 [Xenorhabdus bovienii str. feltiae France]|nr:hypothetical protein XBFFR1_2400001 [Xenorhabdus bovienii str. feltiae France]
MLSPLLLSEIKFFELRIFRVLLNDSLSKIYCLFIFSNNLHAEIGVLHVNIM